jgi:hypothetical protein
VPGLEPVCNLSRVWIAVFVIVQSNQVAKLDRYRRGLIAARADIAVGL